MSATDHLLYDNARYVETFPGGRPLQPRLQLAVVACMDSRIDLFAALGLQVGDAHAIRNAGGQVTEDVLRSLAISQRTIGTREVVVIHHTNCGLFQFDDDAFRAELSAETGQEPDWKVPGFVDLEADVRHSVQRVRECPWLPYRDVVSGFVFDVVTGRLTPVE